MNKIPSLSLFAALSLATALPALAQTTYEWTSPTSGGNWSDFFNWTNISGPGSSVPSTGDTGNLANATANRTVIYDAGASGSFATLNLTQTGAFSNILSVQKALTVTNGITLGATGGGTSQLIIQPGAGSVSLTAPSIAVNSGGKLSLNAGTVNAAQASITGALTVNSGGILEVARGNGAPVTGAYFAFVNGPLTLNAGSTANIFTVTATATDNRLNVSGNFTANLSGSTYATGASLTYFNGATNVITNASSGTRVNFGSVQLGANTDQSLAVSGTNYRITPWLHSSGSSVKTLGSGAVGETLNFFNMTLSQGVGGATTTLKLSSNANLVTDFGNPRSVSADAGTTVDNAGFAIDVNGFTLDLTAGSILLGGNNLAVKNGTTLTFSNSSGTAGTIRSNAFSLTSLNGFLTSSTVGNNITLEATNGSQSYNKANDLGGAAGTISASSRFRYNSSGTDATITSNRTIGAFSVANGTIKIVTAALTVAGDATIGDTTTAGTLDLGGQNLILSGAAKLSGRGTIADTVGAGTVSFASGSTGGLAVGNSGVGTLTFSGTLGGGLNLANASISTFDIASLASFDSVALGSRSATLGGSLALNFLGGYTPTAGDTYALFTTSGSISSSFTTITSNVGGFDYSFNNATGILTVSAIPEPSTYAGLAGLSALSLAFYRRRRAS